MSNHTPAPWTADGDLIRGADGTDILAMDPFGQQEEGVLWANMELIAAAPALLEAAVKADRIEMLRDEVSELYAIINGTGRTTSAESTMTAKRRLVDVRDELRAVRTELRAAIALAEGRTP